MIGPKVMDAILKGCQFDLGRSQEVVTTWKRPVRSAPAKIHLAVASRHFPQAVGYNVVGHRRLRPQAPARGRHHRRPLRPHRRHMGFLFPGADDNASGSHGHGGRQGAWPRWPTSPRDRSSSLFGGEELGLQGSTWFSGHVPGPFDKVAGMFNFDMTGEGDGLWGGVPAEPAEFEGALEEADKSVKVLRGLGVIRGVGVRGSDFAPFFFRASPPPASGRTGRTSPITRPGTRSTGSTPTSWPTPPRWPSWPPTSGPIAKDVMRVAREGLRSSYRRPD